MTDRLEDQLGGAMREEVTSVFAGQELDRNVFARARRLRLRNRITMGTAALAVVILAMPVVGGLLSIGDGRTVSQSAPASSPKGEVTVDLDEMVLGSAPKVSRLVDQTIWDGSRATPILEVDNVENVEFTRLSYGYLINKEAPERSSLIRQDGRILGQLGRAGTVSSDEARLSYVDSKGTYLTDINGNVLESTTAAGESIHFVDHNVVLSNGFLPAAQPRLWNTETGKVNSLPVDGVVLDSDGKSRLLLATQLNKKDAGGLYCTSLYTIGAPKPDWKSCDVLGVRFSADGRYLLAQRGRGVASSKYSILDAATRRPVFTISLIGKGKMKFATMRDWVVEPSGNTFVFVMASTLELPTSAAPSEASVSEPRRSTRPKRSSGSTIELSRGVGDQLRKDDVPHRADRGFVADMAHAFQRDQPAARGSRRRGYSRCHKGTGCLRCRGRSVSEPSQKRVAISTACRRR